MTREIGNSIEGPAEGAQAGADGPVVLVIGDDRNGFRLPDEAFESAGCRLIRVTDFVQAQEDFASIAPDVVFMPLIHEGRLTSNHLLKCLSYNPAPVVVVVASNDQINTAAEAMRLGAYDCLFKPFSHTRLQRTIEAAVNQLNRVPPPPKPSSRPSRPMLPPRKAEPSRPLQGIPKMTRAQRGLANLNLARRGFVASSTRMLALLDRAAIAARSDATVFISGEVGTGKTTLAGLVHEMSPRAHLPLVTLSCATLTPRSVESRISEPQGVFSRAAGGTLYLDEIADLPPDVQPQIARLLESAETDVRVIASTGHDPNTVLRAGLIRPDLYYRLHVAPLALPPLRAREGDPELIARVRLAAFSEAEGRSFNGFSETALAMMDLYDWPGNLRELINVIQTIVLMNEGTLVTAKLFPPEIQAALRPSEATPAAPAAPAGTLRPAAPATDIAAGALVGKTLAEIERTVIEATIRAEDGSVPRAARVLGVSPSTLYRKREAWVKALDHPGAARR